MDEKNSPGRSGKMVPNEFSKGSLFSTFTILGKKALFLKFQQPSTQHLVSCWTQQLRKSRVPKMYTQNGGFLKWWYPTTMGFPTKNDHFEVFWGYHHLRKHPNAVAVSLPGWLAASHRNPSLSIRRPSGARTDAPRATPEELARLFVLKACGFSERWRIPSRELTCPT